MKTVNIIGADPMPEGCRQPEKVNIVINCEASKYTGKFKDLKEVQKFFDQEAEKLCSGLINALPQGVVEPLIIKLLQHRISSHHGVNSNTDLISSAPDLLEALETVRDLPEFKNLWSDKKQMVYKAIAKAHGET